MIPVPDLVDELALRRHRPLVHDLLRRYVVVTDEQVAGIFTRPDRDGRREVARILLALLARDGDVELEELPDGRLVARSAVAARIGA